ncbi:hypothetical protein TREES_T100014316 [Tupaia chinensis]|uniref:Uncharacterized protein n=1 Tax=Tupaia chinensis TaxID=246437 RepID=L9JEP1_TUPCH|nr:hypothetical protein TREES_T100014316 [Tupaia chinensis]
MDTTPPGDIGWPVTAQLCRRETRTLQGQGPCPPQGHLHCPKAPPRPALQVSPAAASPATPHCVKGLSGTGPETELRGSGRGPGAEASVPQVRNGDKNGEHALDLLRLATSPPTSPTALVSRSAPAVTLGTEKAGRPSPALMEQAL